MMYSVVGMGREGAGTTFFDNARGWIDPSPIVPANSLIELMLDYCMYCSVPYAVRLIWFREYAGTGSYIQIPTVEDVCLV